VKSFEAQSQVSFIELLGGMLDKHEYLKIIAKKKQHYFPNRSRKTWMQCVEEPEEDIKLVKLYGDDAQDHVDWRIGNRGDRVTRASTEEQTLKR